MGCEAVTKADLRGLEARLVAAIERVEDRLSLAQWMLGFNLALSVALLWLPQFRETAAIRGQSHAIFCRPSASN